MKRTGKPNDPHLLAASLAPAAPPCFHERTIWREYLASAMEVQMARAGSARGPLLLAPDGRLRLDKLDPDWSFCDDCQFRGAELQHMRQTGACRPSWWRERVPALKDGEQAPKTARHTQGGSRQRRVIPINLIPAGA